MFNDTQVSRALDKIGNGTVRTRGSQ